MRLIRVIAVLLFVVLTATACAAGGKTHLYNKADHTHIFGNAYDVTPTTCQVAGTQIRYCKICHESVMQAVQLPESVELRAHAFLDTVHAPTECEEGYTVRVCSLCGYTLQRVDVRPARYALLTTQATIATPPEGVEALMLSDTATHTLAYAAGGALAVDAEIARRLAVALTVTERMEAENATLTPETQVTLISGIGAGNAFTLRELMTAWIKDGSADVARGFAVALGVDESGFMLRVSERMTRLGVKNAVNIHPFLAGAPNTATCAATTVMLARALDTPLLCESMRAAVPELVRVAGVAPAVYLAAANGTLRVSALATEGGYRFLVLAGKSLPYGAEDALY